MPSVLEFEYLHRRRREIRSGSGGLVGRRDLGPDVADITPAVAPSEGLLRPGIRLVPRDPVGFARVCVQGIRDAVLERTLGRVGRREMPGNQETDHDDPHAGRKPPSVRPGDHRQVRRQHPDQQAQDQWDRQPVDVRVKHGGHERERRDCAQGHPGDPPCFRQAGAAQGEPSPESTGAEQQGPGERPRGSGHPHRIAHGKDQPQQKGSQGQLCRPYPGAEAGVEQCAQADAQCQEGQRVIHAVVGVPARAVLGIERQQQAQSQVLDPHDDRDDQKRGPCPSSTPRSDACFQRSPKASAPTQTRAARTSNGTAQLCG